MAESYIRNGFPTVEQKALQCATISIIGCGGFNTLDTPPNVLPMTVSLIASMQAAEVCKYILQQDSPLQSSISRQCDLLHCQYELINKI